MKNLRKIILAALFAALTFVATFVIKLPTPTMGYIHPGDALVILCGVLLGPWTGGLAAGIGSMLSDLIGGYISYVPGTFVIKFFVAVIAAYITKWILRVSGGGKTKVWYVIIGGVFGEVFMVLGYFVYEIFLEALGTGAGLTKTTLLAGIAASAAGIPFNIVQAIFGVVLSAILFPILNPLLKKSLES